jgi:hypothetical protein
VRCLTVVLENRYLLMLDPQPLMQNGPSPMKNAWYLDLTPNRMFSLYDNYPIPGKTGLPLCKLHGQQLELKETVVRDNEATGKSHFENCWGRKV